MEKYEIPKPPKSKTVRLDMQSLVIEIIPLCKNKLKVTMVMKSNPRIRFIPMSLINYLGRKVILTTNIQ